MPEPKKKKKKIKKKRKKLPSKSRAPDRAIDRAFDAEEKEIARRQESTVAPNSLEVVHPHYSLHLHIAWDVGYKSVYKDVWEQERTLYHIIQQSSRFVVHRRDYKIYADRDLDQSYTVCSIEFHDTAKTVPVAQLDQYGDPHKLLAELAKG